MRVVAFPVQKTFGDQSSELCPFEQFISCLKSFRRTHEFHEDSMFAPQAVRIGDQAPVRVRGIRFNQNELASWANKTYRLGKRGLFGVHMVQSMFKKDQVEHAVFE